MRRCYFAVATSILFWLSSTWHYVQSAQSRHFAKQICKKSGCDCKVAWTGKYFPGTTLEVVDGISVLRCLKICASTPECKSVTYEMPDDEDPSSCLINSDAISEISNPFIKAEMTKEDPTVVYFEPGSCQFSGSLGKANKALQILVCGRKQQLNQATEDEGTNTKGQTSKDVTKEQGCDGRSHEVKALDCACRKNFRRRGEDHKCVPKAKCDVLKKKRRCPQNEEYVHLDECYEEKSCQESADTSVCGGQCACRSGFARNNDTGLCILEEKCPGQARGKRQTTCGQPAVTPKQRSGRIINGDEALEYSWPWQVYFKKQGCGGTIYNSQYIISAAHCFSENDKRITAVLGSHLRNRIKKKDGGEKIKVTAVKRHPYFQSLTFSNDIALLKLIRPMTLNSVKTPICLPGTMIPVGQTAYITGWGRIEANKKKLARELRQADVKIMDSSICNDGGHYGGLVLVDRQFCAGNTGSDACFGDSGGPLVYNSGSGWELQGITSWGVGCNTAQYPGVYTRVLNYTNWITQTVSQGF